MMSEEFPIDSIIADPLLLMNLHQFGGVHLTRITAANPCTDTLSITRYGDTVSCDNFLWMTLKLNNDTSVVNACLNLTIFFQHLLSIAGPNYYGCLNAEPNDLYYKGDETFEQISLWRPYTNTERAWDFQTGSDKIKVGIIDNGIDYRHCDLGPYGGDKVKGGWNYASNPQRSSFYDLSNHGTQMAGIIGAYTNGVSEGCTHTGIAGIAGGWYTEYKYGCSLYGFKVDINRTTDIEILLNRVIGAILDATSDYDTEHEKVIKSSFAVDIINCSWGFGSYDEGLRHAFNFAFEHGVSIVCSRGNIVEGNPKMWFPAVFEPSWIFSVGGLDTDHTRFNRSWYGNKFDLLAPAYGPEIVTTDIFAGQKHNYIKIGETSSAAAHVTGAIALLRSEFLENSKYRHVKPEPEDYENIIKSAAFDLNFDPDNQDDELKTHVGYDNVSGWGELKIGNIFVKLDAGLNLYHEKITELDEPEEFTGNPELIRLITWAKEEYTKTVYKAQKREITGSKILSNYHLPQLYVWGRSGLSDKTGKGGLSPANPLYKSTKYTEVTSGSGGNGIVNGIYHHDNPVVSAKTYQYKLFDPITNEFVRYEPELEDIELHFSVFGIKDPTSVNNYVNFEHTTLIFPNPANEQFTLRFKTTTFCSPVIRIYNLLGQIVYQKSIDGLHPDFHEIDINSKNLINGLYTIEINTGNTIQSQKLMVIK
jgi:subtilisin family serine protease